MPALVIAPITLDQLTTTVVDGAGVFDKLMTAMTAHLDREYQGQRLKGQDYAQVYLGSVTAILSNSVAFLLQKDEAAGKAALIEAQIRLLEVQIAREEFDKQLVVAQTAKVVQETANLVLEGDNLVAQNCLLKAQYDLTMMNKLQVIAQTSLVQQKISTEKAQTIETGVDDNSVVGRQKLLYKAQTDGFQRDAEQKMLKIVVDSWNVRRTTDEGTEANATNMLYDTTIGRLVNRGLTGVGA
jgi:hypothetical protein